MTTTGNETLHDRYPLAFRAAWPAVYHELRGPRQGQALHWQRVADNVLALFGTAAPGRARGVGGVVLAGKTGRGKTALASLAAKLCDQKLHVSPGLIRCADLREKLRGLPSDRDMDVPDFLALAEPATHPFLLLDDIGLEKGNAEAEDVVRMVLDKRTLTPCFTAITTNLDWPDLIEHLGGERYESRVAALEYIDFTGLPDYRKEPRHA